MNAHSLSVILPCYNEAEALPRVIENWQAASRDFEPHLGAGNFELIVVDDGSTDATPQILARYPFIRTVRHSFNRGYGEAIKSGLKEAHGEWMAFYDCDGTCSAQNLIDLWQHRTSADLVVGHRITPRSRMPKIRKIGNAFYQTLFSLLWLSKAHDVCSGYRLFHRKWRDPFMQHLPCQLNFTLAMSLWMTQHGFSIQQVPIHYADRLGVSKLSVVRDGVKFLFTLLHFRVRFFSK